MTKKLEYVVLDLIAHAHDRCGVGFGKYPSGLRHAIAQLLPLTHHLVDFPDPGFWRPELGIFVVPKSQLRVCDGRSADPPGASVSDR